ncbi:MAG: heparinase [Mesorhizobium sp.]|uniref:heparinase II/III family protein n=1 Tax=unclassified Mesorhizobium TaxID=325217 RepID=UPI000801CF49|nr:MULTISPECIES: heparinase II/III family protein [unclassified Mesorhizobium]TGV94170.1 heparinase [Mesorhizobium sp. M00.F.Ca.ET.158.01.1.1]WIE92555.1 heparinase II/III family protein [Mesorhizobium sp. WSM4875]AZO60690.1 heparinase [Mesorhizobium sp. M1A.F.Ca.IN.022.06.1.1]MCT2575745.1 heparinase II/III family protein [Mesorhizobium sp. P13.3]MDF3165321.1 heparinase II/III family protein [Mesorhizobium sp. P16.1]
MALAAGSTTRLWTLVAREFWRKTRRRLRAGPIYRWRYSGRTPERVLIAPPDLRLADPQIALEIYYGRYPLSGHMVETGGKSPFQINVPNRGWQKSLHGFRWLRHMRAAGTELAAANARALVSDWIVMHGNQISGVAWEPGTTAKRVIAWLQHSSVVLQGAEFPFYRAFLKSLAMQIRYLRSMAREMPDGKDRLRARIALAFSTLSLPAPASALRAATRNLAEELDHQILPDGGHISRNPMTVLELLADLLPLRQTYANQAEAPPPALINAIDRMLPALRFFRHQDGSLARFNGMGATIHDRIATILRHDDTVGAPLLHAPHSGYERLSMGGVTVIADTGLPPPVDISNAAHAGCLAFELSSGRQHFIVNAGIDTYGAAEFRPLARATAAHSTATVNDTSSARFSHSLRVSDLLGSPLIGGPQHVPCKRIDQKGVQGFVARHDGYAARFGLLHEREVKLAENGNVLTGRDRFLRPGGAAIRNNGRDFVTVRFHIHPDIGLLHDEQGRLTLAASQGDTWVFTCAEVAPEIEESIYFAGLGGPRRSRQIVLAFKASEIAEVHWQLTRAAVAGYPENN